MLQPEMAKLQYCQFAKYSQHTLKHKDTISNVTDLLIKKNSIPLPQIETIWSSNFVITINFKHLFTSTY